MGFSIVGSSLNSSVTAKVLQRQNFNKEPNGLETIIEAYAIKTENRDLIVPERNTPHSVFSSYAKKYPKMVVESVTTEEQDGGITQMLVTYVGLTTNTLPPPIVRLIPTAGAGVYGPPLVIEAEYVTDVSETQFMAGQLAQNTGLGRQQIFNQQIKMPAVINGTQMPRDPAQAFYSAPKSGFGGGAIIQYSGYCVLSMSCDRRGLFLIARNTYHEVQQVAILTQTAFR
jgi:hypothetical protein